MSVASSDPTRHRQRGEHGSVCVGVEAAAIDLDAQQLLEADVADVNTRAEMTQEVELAFLVGGLENGPLHAKGRREALCRVEVEPSGLVEEADRLRALTSFDDDRASAGVEPIEAGCNELRDDLVVQRAAVLVPELHLDG